MKVLSASVLAIWTSVTFGRQRRFDPPKDWRYDLANFTVPGKINVHVVPHTHDDTGWLKTVDGYFQSEVRFILDSVIDALAKHPTHRFTYVEMAFFSRWWNEQTPERKDLVRRLVQDNQLVFTNGGWCMHDEAGPLFNEMIDQTTRGHQFIMQEFGKEATPRATWQVDPFGHSSTQAWLLAADAGMPAMFWARMDDDDRDARRKTKQLEYIWRGSKSRGSRSETFSGFIWGREGKGLYNCPLEFDPYQGGVQDNPGRHDYNVEEYVDFVVDAAQKQANEYETIHIMWTCGEDFNYKNANTWFRNLDVLMHYVNQDGRVHMLYSTPTDYADAKNADEDMEWSVREDDLMPYREGAHNYWTGYFASRVAFKRLIRSSANLLGSARQVEYFTHDKNPVEKDVTLPHSPDVGSGWTDGLEGSVALSMHHDGVSGTAKQAVTNDYKQRISEGEALVEQGMSAGISLLLGLNNDTTWKYCRALNISICEPTSHIDNESFAVAAWNQRAQTYRDFTFRIPVSLKSLSETFSVTAIDRPHTIISSQLVEIDTRTLRLPLMYLNYFGLSQEEISAAHTRLQNNATHVLIFQQDIPPVGIAAFNIERVQNDYNKKHQEAMEIPVESTNTTFFGNDILRVHLDPDTNAVTSISDMRTGESCDMTIEWGWYESSQGGCSEFGCSPQTSGAYIFRPNSSAFHYPGEKPVKIATQIVRGPIAVEIRQQVSPWVSHVVRLVHGKPSVQIEYTVGPIPIENVWLPGRGPLGKEVAVRYGTCIMSNKTFYTDSNGLEMIKRVRDERPSDHPQTYAWLDEPIASNYYPVNSMISIRDRKRSFTVITDSSQGGTSLQNGQVELMVHRRTLFDDFKGVAEPLNETMCGCNGGNDQSACHCHGLTIRGTHDIVFGDMAAVRQANAQQQFRPVVFVTEDKVDSHGQSLWSGIQAELPENVHLLTVVRNYANIIGVENIVLRLQHTFAVDEDPELSKPVTISLKTLFRENEVGSYLGAVETTLTATMMVESKYTYKWKTTRKSNDPPATVPFDGSNGLVTLQPMEIRTFVINMGPPNQQRVALGNHTESTPASGGKKESPIQEEY